MQEKQQVFLWNGSIVIGQTHLGQDHHACPPAAARTGAAAAAAAAAAAGDTAGHTGHSGESAGDGTARASDGAPGAWPQQQLLPLSACTAAAAFHAECHAESVPAAAYHAGEDFPSHAVPMHIAAPVAAAAPDAGSACRMVVVLGGSASHAVPDAAYQAGAVKPLK